jgi:uncharacterized phage protein gp47/JayE
VTIGGITITPLKLWGALVGIFQKPGKRTELDIEITVITQGGTLASGTRFVNLATEMIYTLVGDVALDDDTVYGTIRATKVGDLGNVDDDTELAFVSPPSSVQKTVTVNATVTVGANKEKTEVFRERIMERFAARPQGGAYADYRDWAEEVAGVRNAYPYSGWLDRKIQDSKAGQVFVYVESSADPDGIPSSPLLDDVKDYIEADASGLANRRNINAYVNVLPITRTTFDVTISGLTSENIPDTKDAIEAGLTDFFLDREPFITGLSRPPRKDFITTFLVGGVVGRIAASYSGHVLSVAVSVSSTAYDIYPLQEGEKAKLGTITWT